MSASERAKGAKGEREVAAVFRAVGFDCDRTPNSGGLRIKGDLAGTVPAHVEVKRQEVLRLPLWLKQARAEAPPGVVPVVAFRQSRGEWYAAVLLGHLAGLMAAAELATRQATLLPRCNAPTEHGYKCAYITGHRGQHSHPNERAA